MENEKNSALTEEEQAVLDDVEPVDQNVEIKDDTEDPSPSDAKDPEEKEEEPNKDSSGDPVILARDGKNVIPYSELESERELRSAAEKELAELKTPEKEPEVEDPDADLRAMSPTERREFRDYAENDELERIDAFEAKERVARDAALTAKNDDEAKVLAFMTKHEAVFTADPQLAPILDVIFSAALKDGKTADEALADVETRMLSMRLLEAPATPEDEATAKDKIAAKVGSLEATTIAPRTLENAAGVSETLVAPDADGDAYAAEDAYNNMSEAERDRWLRTS